MWRVHNGFLPKKSSTKYSNDKIKEEEERVFKSAFRLHMTLQDNRRKLDNVSDGTYLIVIVKLFFFFFFPIFLMPFLGVGISLYLWIL
jgi:hypothetical protein